MLVGDRHLTSLTLALGLTLTSAATSTFAQGAPDGAALFQQRCSMCHTIVPGQAHGVGPNLAGVVGRKAASSVFNYSAALKASGLTWDRATLDRFLTAPGQMVPGTRMVVAIPDSGERAAVIAYLAKHKT